MAARDVTTQYQFGLNGEEIDPAPVLADMVRDLRAGLEAP